MNNLFFTLLLFTSFGLYSQTEFTLQTEDSTPEINSALDSIVLDSNVIKIKINDVFIELGGITGVYSINYQRKLIELGKFNIKARTGFNVLIFNDLGLDYAFFLGGSLSYQATTKSSLSLGAGQVYYSYMVFDFFEVEGMKRNTEYYTYFDLSYRFSFNNKWFMSASYTPVILYYEPNELGAVFESWGGLSIGYSF
jgi:hypothetical protein